MGLRHRARPRAVKTFAELFETLDGENSTNAKSAALRAHFASASPEDAAWALYFLAGERLPSPVSGRTLRAWAGEAAGIPAWLVEESYAQIGDQAETVTLLLPDPVDPPVVTLSEIVTRHLRPLSGGTPAEQSRLIRRAWAELGRTDRFVFNKLLAGSFRVGVQKTLVTKALAEVAGLEPAVMAARLTGRIEPTPEFFQKLLRPENESDEEPRPLPFFLASPLAGDPSELGPKTEWTAEWKYDGIRAQLLKSQGEVWLWSRGGEPVTTAFPELAQAGNRLPEGTVLDGEILVWTPGNDQPSPFGDLQQRLNRKTAPAALRSRFPAVFVAYDLLRLHRADLRGKPQSERRAELEKLAAPWPSSGTLRASPLLEGNWEELAALRRQSRERGVEGLMLKHRDATYASGRVKGGWFKWKVDPLSLDFVMTFAQAGHGRRAGLHTDYTFALWQAGELVTVTKAYSGLSDAEIQQVERFVRKNTLDTFGPVRRLTPTLVCEIGFEGVTQSPRHKSGFALRFPRILRLREDKPAAEADTVDHLRALARQSGFEAGATGSPAFRQQWLFPDP